MTTRTLAVGLRALIVIGATLVAGRAQSGTQPGFQKVLPPGTLVFVGIDDTRAYGEQFRSSPLGKLWNDPDCAPLRQMVSEQIGVLGDEAKMALGVDVLRLPSLLEGPVAFALLDLVVQPGREEDPGLSFCVLADVGTQVDECRALLDGLAEHLLSGQTGIVRSTLSLDQTEVVSFLDSRVDEQSGSRLRYALQGSVAVVLVETGGLRRDDLPGILAGLKSPGSATLASQQSFANSLAGAGGSSLRVYADLGSLIARVHPVPPADQPLSADERQLLSLGVRDLGVFSIRGQCGPKGSFAALRLDWPGDGWIPRMLRNFFQPGDFTRLRFAPATARGVDALRIDLPGVFDGVVKVLIESGAQTPAEIVASLQEAQDFLGFDPREDLLEQFDGEFVLISGDVDPQEALPSMTEALNVALIAGLNDPAAFQAFLDGIIHRRGLHVTHSTEDFEGATLHFQTLFPLPMPICYAIVDDMLVLSGAPSLVRQIVHQRNAPETPGLTALPAYREAIAVLHPGYGLLGYSDAAADMRSLLRFLEKAPQMFGEHQVDADASGLLTWLSQVPLPDESIVEKYFHGGTATAFTVDDNGLYLESAGP